MSQGTDSGWLPPQTWMMQAVQLISFSRKTKRAFRIKFLWHRQAKLFVYIALTYLRSVKFPLTEFFCSKIPLITLPFRNSVPLAAIVPLLPSQVRRLTRLSICSQYYYVSSPQATNSRIIFFTNGRQAQAIKKERSQDNKRILKYVVTIKYIWLFRVEVSRYWWDGDIKNDSLYRTGLQRVREFRWSGYVFATWDKDRKTLEKDIWRGYHHQKEQMRCKSRRSMARAWQVSTVQVKTPKDGFDDKNYHLAVEK